VPLVELLLDGQKYFRPDELPADEEAGGDLPRRKPHMKTDRHDTSQSDAERRRLTASSLQRSFSSVELF
jgi:hypothetical protein